MTRSPQGLLWFWMRLLFSVTAGAGLILCGSTEAQQPPRNVTFDRYAIHQTFDGQAFPKDDNVWTYTASLVETFGMHADGVAPELKSIEAAGYRLNP